MLTTLNFNAVCMTSNYYVHEKNYQDTIKRVGPQIVFKINAKNYNVDSDILKRIDTTWIKKIEIIKDKKYKNIYDPPPEESVALIFFKRKYSRQVYELIETKK